MYIDKFHNQQHVIPTKHANTHAVSITYISKDKVFAGGRFIVSMAIPDFSSIVLMTKSVVDDADVGE